jgi:hypothetical protein
MFIKQDNWCVTFSFITANVLKIYLAWDAVFGICMKILGWHRIE